MGKSRKDYEKFLNSISPDRDDEAWIIGGKNRYCGRENYGTMIKRYDPIGFNVGYREWVEQPENKNKTFILGTRKTGCDIIVLGGTNCGGSDMDWLFGCLGNENFYVCQPVSFYKSQQEIQKVNPLYAFKVATAYFREQGKVPVFEDSNCRLIKL